MKGDERTWTILVSLDGKAVLGGASDSKYTHLAQELLPHERVAVVEVSPVPSAPGGPSEEATIAAARRKHPLWGQYREKAQTEILADLYPMLQAAYAIDGLPAVVGDEGDGTVTSGAAGGLGGPDGA